MSVLELDELIELRQNQKTLLLQDIERSVDGIYQTLTTRLVPTLDQYSAACEETWDLLQIWVKFFESLEVSSEPLVPPLPSPSLISKAPSVFNQGSILENQILKDLSPPPLPPTTPTPEVRHPITPQPASLNTLVQRILTVSAKKANPELSDSDMDIGMSPPVTIPFSSVGETGHFKQRSSKLSIELSQESEENWRPMKRTRLLDKFQQVFDRFETAGSNDKIVGLSEPESQLVIENAKRTGTALLNRMETIKEQSKLLDESLSTFSAIIDPTTSNNTTTTTTTTNNHSFALNDTTTLRMITTSTPNNQHTLKSFALSDDSD